MLIFLIGYMGCGKSTAGKKLASKLKAGFADLDDYIEEQYGRSVDEIFETEGENRFRELEYNGLKHFLEKDKLVLAVGGGTPCFYDNMELMKRYGITVYLKMSAEALASRLLSAKKVRPLIKNKSEAELKTYINAHLEKREPFYLQAQYKVKAKDLDVDELAEFLQKETLNDH